MNIMFAAFNGVEIVGLLVLVLILFGAKKLPELARGLGQGIKEFKKASRDVQDEFQAAIDLESPPAPPVAKKISSETQPPASEPEPQKVTEQKA